MRIQHIFESIVYTKQKHGSLLLDTLLVNYAIVNSLGLLYLNSQMENIPSDR